jgi:glycosyltransferase involved in cell wall biosynthesis
MEIHFFTKGGRNIGSSRQRVFLVADNLKIRGHSTFIHEPFFGDFSKVKWPGKARLIIQLARAFWSVSRGGIVFAHKGIYNKYFLLLLTIHKLVFKKKIVSDFDDPIFIHSPLKTNLLLKLSDAVIVGSHFNYKWASKRHKNVRIIPTSIQYSVYSKFSKNYNAGPPDMPVIGWLGSGPAHYVNLRHLLPILKKLVNEGVIFQFTLVGAAGDRRLYDLLDIPGLKKNIIDMLDWENPENAAREIGKFDIGIMPLEDVDSEKGKCAFKAIEYMACGVATVASAVGENNYLIKNRENGLLVKDWEDWPGKIKALLNSRELREKLGKAGQETIRENYSFEANIPKIEEIIKSVLK